MPPPLLIIAPIIGIFAMVVVFIAIKAMPESEDKYGETYTSSTHFGKDDDCNDPPPAIKHRKTRTVPKKKDKDSGNEEDDDNDNPKQKKKNVKARQRSRRSNDEIPPSYNSCVSSSNGTHPWKHNHCHCMQSCGHQHCKSQSSHNMCCVNSWKSHHPCCGAFLFDRSLQMPHSEISSSNDCLSAVNPSSTTLNTESFEDDYHSDSSQRLSSDIDDGISVCSTSTSTSSGESLRSRSSDLDDGISVCSTSTSISTSTSTSSDESLRSRSSGSSFHSCRSSGQKDRKCSICVETKPSNQMVRLKPCRHKGVCKNCIETMLKNTSECPLCRQPIKSYTQSI